MDAKDTWPVIKFLVSATGLKKRDARKMLQEIPEDRYGQLFIQSRAWDREMLLDASKRLGIILGEANVATLVEATKLAQVPSTEQGQQDDDEDEDAPRRRKPPARARKRL